MRAIDADAVVRSPIAHDPRRHATARQIMTGHVPIPRTMSQEVVRLLPSRYRMTRRAVAGATGSLLDTRTVPMPDIDLVRRVIAGLMHGVDFAAMPHLPTAGEATGLVAIDKGIARHVGPLSPLPIETLST